MSRCEPVSVANAVRTHHLRHFQNAGFRRETGAVLPENVSRCATMPGAASAATPCWQA